MGRLPGSHGLGREGELRRRPAAPAPRRSSPGSSTSRSGAGSLPDGRSRRRRRRGRRRGGAEPAACTCAVAFDVADAVPSVLRAVTSTRRRRPCSALVGTNCVLVAPVMSVQLAIEPSTSHASTGRRREAAPSRSRRRRSPSASRRRSSSPGSSAACCCAVPARRRRGGRRCLDRRPSRSTRAVWVPRLFEAVTRKRSRCPTSSLEGM